MAESVIQICNLALQKVGSARIASLDEDNEDARLCALAYVPMRNMELRAHAWNFAIKRAVLAPDETAPAFGYSWAFTLPPDYLRYVKVKGGLHDWKIEGGKLLTNEGNVLYLPYIYKVADPALHDPLFDEMLACRIGVQLCEARTQSNTKKADIWELYRDAKREARRMNAFENEAQEPPEDSYITVRR